MTKEQKEACNDLMVYLQEFGEGCTYCEHAINSEPCALGLESQGNALCKKFVPYTFKITAHLDGYIDILNEMRDRLTEESKRWKG